MVKRNNIIPIVIINAAAIPPHGFGRFPIPEVNIITPAIVTYNMAMKEIFTF